MSAEYLFWELLLPAKVVTCGTQQEGTGDKMRLSPTLFRLTCLGSALVLLGLLYVGWVSFSEQDYAEFEQVGTDVSGRYRVYGKGSVVILTRDDVEFFQTTPDSYVKLINRPQFNEGGRIRFKRSEYEGVGMWEIFNERAKKTTVRDGVWSIWVGHKDGSHEIVQVRKEIGLS